MNWDFCDRNTIQTVHYFNLFNIKFAEHVSGQTACSEGLCSFYEFTLFKFWTSLMKRQVLIKNV